MHSSQLPERTPAELRIAEGYCELGMWTDAWEELEQLSPERRADMDVMWLRLTILVNLERWEYAGFLAASLVAKGDHHPNTYITGAYAIRRSQGLEAARNFLLSGAADLKECATYYFNMACYECQLGHLEEAKQLLSRAIKLEPECRQQALEEPDLQALW